MEKLSSESMEALLPSPYSDSLITRRESYCRWLANQWMLLAISILTIYVAIVVTLQTFRSSVKPGMPYSPANPVIRYERHRLWEGKPSIFAQSPSNEVDNAWEDLLAGKNVRASQEEMIMGKENMTNSVQLADGGYLAILGVYHQLHCLNILRKGLYPEYYKPKMGDHDRQVNYNSDHFDHCIERIRKSVMCHADVAMYSAEWVADSHQVNNKLLRSNAEVTCVNWHALDSWARERALVRKEYLVKAGPFEHTHPADGSSD